MPPLEQVTPVVLTLDEEANIGRTLSQLRWATRVVVIDSGSRDRTQEIVRSFRNTDLAIRPFVSHSDQWNFASARSDTEWVLALDADYYVPEAFVSELAAIPSDTPHNGFVAGFDYAILGRLLRASLYPPRQVLFRTARAVFEQDGHTQRVRVEGSSGRLEHRIVHDDRKPLDRWLRNQINYARTESTALWSVSRSQLSLPDRIRRTAILGPPFVLLYCLFGKGLVLDGWAGWYYTLERTVAEAILSMTLLRTLLRPEAAGGHPA